ncbi:cilia- and flagella-associated protein 73 [Mus caroli]|uniref:Cilia- and flagella-associated protein 73 n=1 Tax=Mus caroli TaxID=10089 RepID=A0A6P5PR86_MUSCR|nr:cilia- and flagella-associated protein 73 [Mus caroli]
MAVAWEEYFRLVFSEKVQPKPLEQTGDDSSVLQLILEKKEELAVADLGLQAQKKEYRSTIESVNQRWRELEQKGQELQGSVISYDKFLKEVEARRAARKAIEERKITSNLDAELRRLRTQLKELRLQRARLQRKVQRLEPCERMLKRALEKRPVFQEVSDLVARFESLVSTKAALKLAEQKRLVEMESTRAQLLSLQSEKQDEMLSLNQQRTQLVEQLEAAREHRQQWESKWIEILNSASEKTLLLGRARMAVLNLYHLVRLQQGRRQTLDVKDVEGQLEEVKRFIMSISATLANLAQAQPTATAS